MEDYSTPKETSKILKVSPQTLKRWERDGLIKTFRTPGGKRMYNVKQYLINNNLIENEHQTKKTKQNICYCRVSSQSQHDDLERQIKYMTKQYPNYTIIKDIGSGLNFKRKGLNTIIDLAINDELDEVVIAYKDRLARFGYDLIERLINKYSSGKIIVLNDCTKSPQDELTNDLVSIMNVFSAKLNGMRKYKNTQ